VFEQKDTQRTHHTQCKLADYPSLSSFQQDENYFFSLNKEKNALAERWVGKNVV